MSVSDIESGVSSLLKTCGCLKSSVLPSHFNKTITYKDKDYESATEALEAYISDFASSQQTGKLKLPVTSSHTDTHFFGECVNSTELDSLFLTGRHHREPDIFSMTTEELLTLPYDGSLPVTHTSAHNLQDLLASETDLCAKTAACIQCLTCEQMYNTTRHREHRSVLDVSRRTESLCPIHRDSKTHSIPLWLNDPSLTPNSFDPSHALDHTAPSWLRDIEEEDGVMKKKQGCEKVMRQAVDRDRESDQGFQAGKLLDTDRWWENPITFKSPAEDAIDNEKTTQTLIDTTMQTAGCRKQPRPVETLKHMLFNMQAAQTQEVCETQFKDADSGGLSIQRALDHLDHLKSLVEKSAQSEKQRKDK